MKKKIELAAVNLGIVASLVGIIGAVSLGEWATALFAALAFVSLFLLALSIRGILRRDSWIAELRSNLGDGP